MTGPPHQRPIPKSNPLYARDDWPLVRKKLRSVAYRFTSSVDKATHVASAAILACIDSPKQPYKLGHKQLVQWLCKRVAWMVFNSQRHDERFEDVAVAQEGARDEADDGTSYTVGAILRSQLPDPETAYFSAEAEAIFRRRMVLLALKVAPDALVALLVLRVREGDEAPIDAALAHGYSAADVYNARKRLERAAHEVLDDERRAAQEKKKEGPP